MTTPPTLDAIRARLVSDEPAVVIEAAAGCGKTYEAVRATVALAGQLGADQEVLLLTHTNAARGVFEARIKAAGVRARMQTIDSLALDIVKRYAPHLNLMTPVLPNAIHLGHPSFKQIEALAITLLREAPAVAQGIAYRHPVIVADEHQDSTRQQHEIVHLLATAAEGSRVRYFGDSLQSIFGFAGGGDAWDELCETEVVSTLTHGWRWQSNPPLRDWLATARAALLAGTPIPLDQLPECVHLYAWSGSPPPRSQRGYVPDVIKHMSALRLPPKSAVLTLENKHGQGLAERLSHRGYTLYEGASPKAAHEVLEKVLACAGHPPQMSRLLVSVMRDWGTGVTQATVDAVASICRDGGIDEGRHVNALPFVNLCRPLYTSPTVETWLDCFRAAIAARRDLQWRVIQGDAAWLFAATTDIADDPRNALVATARGRAVSSKPGRAAIMTVHRAKGSEFDAVVLPYISGSSFGTKREDAKKLYVALSRAQHDLHLMFSTDDPSPRFAT